MSFVTYLPGTARLTLAKNYVVHDLVLRILISGIPVKERGHIEAGVDTWMLQLVQEKSQQTTAASALNARGQAFEFIACAAR